MASTQNSSVPLVDPGNPDNSYLIQKLEGTASVGSQMPLGRSALPASTISLIRQWIAEGAMNTTAPNAPSNSPPNTPPIVTSTNPENGETVTALKDH